MDYVWPIWWVHTLSWVHGELVLFSGNTGLTQWQRCPPGVYTKFPQYHWPLEMEPVDTYWCDHRWYCSYQESAKSLLDHLAFQMDHTLSHWCQICQLEDVWIKPGETPDELIDHLRALANRCNFSTDEEKEWNFQFHLICALTDSELVKKLLTLDLKATAAEILETCRTHIAIADNLNAMGLRSKTINAVNKWSQQPQCFPQQQQQKASNPQNQHACGNCTKSHAPGRIQTRSHPDMGPMAENKSRPTLLM